MSGDISACRRVRTTSTGFAIALPTMPAQQPAAAAFAWVRCAYWFACVRVAAHAHCQCGLAGGAIKSVCQSTCRKRVTALLV